MREADQNAKLPVKSDKKYRERVARVDSFIRKEKVFPYPRVACNASCPFHLETSQDTEI